MTGQWEEEKRQAQMAFTSPQSDMEAAHQSVDNFYRQILTRGYIEPIAGDKSLNQQILEGDFREPYLMSDAEIERVAEHDLGIWETSRNMDIEPER